MTAQPVVTPKFKAAIDLLGRTGASGFEIRWSGGGDDAEQPPIAWITIALYQGRFECAAAATPELAALRLCEQLIDGGTCIHCGRLTVFDADFHDDPFGNSMCWYMWDPELQVWRRGCE